MNSREKVTRIFNRKLDGTVELIAFLTGKKDLIIWMLYC